MTFDEAEQQIKGQGWTYKHSDGRYDTIWGVLQELRETYAKPVEMTREQVDLINRHRENSTFTELILCINDS